MGEIVAKGFGISLVGKGVLLEVRGFDESEILARGKITSSKREIYDTDDLLAAIGNI